jgi:RNA polymerase sigma factor (sigma-70 family)
LTDTELFSAVSADGPERGPALAELRALLVRGASKALAGRYGKSVAVEDIVHDALIKILATLDQYQGRSAFTTWAMTIAIRVGISELRRKYHADQSLEAFHPDDSGRFEISVGNSATLESLQSRQELLHVLQELIDHHLTDKQRVVIRAYLSDYSTDGIADALGMKRNAVYKLLHDARMRLKDGLAAAGYGAEDVLSLLSAEASRP